MKFIIEGNPISDARPRHTTMKGKTWNYDPKSKKKLITCRQIKSQILEALKSEDTEIVKEASDLTQDGYFEVDLIFHLPMPKSFNTKKINAVLQGFKQMNSKPDIDNLVKYYLDCCNKLLYPDDRMITHLTATKCYSENPRTVIFVKKTKEFI